MYYVEFLRVARALRVYAIVLAGVFLIAVLVRVSAGPALHEQFMKNFSPSAVRTVHNSGGVETVTIVDPVNRTRVVQHQSRAGWDLTIIEAPGSHHAHAHRRDRQRGEPGGLLQVQERDLPDGSHVTYLRSDRRYPLAMLVLLAGFVAGLFATVIGGSLSRENDGHLELVWTKPVSRMQAALTMFGIDIAGIYAAFILCALTVELCIALFVGPPVITLEPDSGTHLALALLFPLAWYAMTQAVSASLGRSGRMLCGLLWVPAMIVPTMTAVPYPLIRLMMRAVDTLNPFAYFAVHVGRFSPTLLPLTPAWNITALAALTILAIAASLAQWHRLEA